MAYMGKESKKEWIDSQMALVVKNLPADAGATEVKAGSPGGRSPGGGRGDLSSILAWRIPMDRGAWRATVHRVARSQTQLKRLSTHTLIHVDLILAWT